MSIAMAECVREPLLMKSTHVLAMAATVARVTLPLPSVSITARERERERYTYIGEQPVA
jgi:hypothetical protein